MPSQNSQKKRHLSFW